MADASAKDTGCGYKMMEKYARSTALLALRLYNNKVSAGVAMIWKSISGLAGLS